MQSVVRALYVLDPIAKYVNTLMRYSNPNRKNSFSTYFRVNPKSCFTKAMLIPLTFKLIKKY